MEYTKENMLELIIIRGLPGTGKSTRAKKDYPNYLHYETDHLFCDTQGRYRFDAQLWTIAMNWLSAIVDIALAKKECVVVSDVFATKESYQRFIDLANAHGANVKIITCKECYGNTHRVPVFIMDKMRSEFEEIDAEE